MLYMNTHRRKATIVQISSAVTHLAFCLTQCMSAKIVYYNNEQYTSVSDSSVGVENVYIVVQAQNMSFKTTIISLGH